MGAPKISVPAASASEQALQKAQADMLRQQQDILKSQQAQQKILLPFLAQQSGFKVQLDKNGNLTGITEIDDPLKQQAKTLQGLEQQRAIDALQGNLPVDPALEQQLGSQEQTLRERLQRQFGSGYETSTAGSQTLGQFFNSAEGLRSEARSGQLTLAEQLGMARQGLGLDTQAQGLNTLSGATTGTPLSLFQGYGALSQGYGNAQVPYMQQRQMQFNANSQNAQNSMAAMQGWGQLAGTMFGAWMGS